MLAPYISFLLLLPLVSGQHSGGDPAARTELDSVLQGYGFRAFFRPRTGIVYEGQPPSNLTGVRIAAVRLRSGSLWRRGVSQYNEFRIPVGVVVHPYVERLAFVYQNLGNWSSFYYELTGFTFLAPVLGLLAYDASNLSARGLPPLEIRLASDPISVSFSDLVSFSHLVSTRCVYFGLNGSFELSEVVNHSTCLTNNQGHFSIVTESSSIPAPPPPPRTGVNRRLWIIVGSVVGGVALLLLLAVGIYVLVVCIRRKKIRQMEAEAEVGVPLPMTSVGYTKAPVAAETRTRPAIETEFVP